MEGEARCREAEWEADDEGPPWDWLEDMEEIFESPRACPSVRGAPTTDILLKNVRIPERRSGELGGDGRLLAEEGSALLGGDDALVGGTLGEASGSTTSKYAGASSL